MVLAAVAACGHVGYDPLADGGGDDVDAPDGDGDGPPGLQPIHEWRLEGNYRDVYGGPDLSGIGGTFTAGGYHFGPNQGLGVFGAMPPSVYTVDFVFSFEALDGWKKIIDYKDKTTDEGFYTYNPNLQFVVVAGSVFSTGTTTLQPDVTYQATITRDGAGVTTGYIDRVQEWQFTDTAGVATLQGVTAPVHFFIDDNATGGGEAASGTVRRIRIYDVPLTAGQLQP